MGETVINFYLSTFIETFIFLLYFATIVICGWFAATRGWTEVQPDGSVKKFGKILKWWYFFWFQEIGINKIIYNNENLIKLRNEYCSYNRVKGDDIHIVGNFLNFNKASLSAIILWLQTKQLKHSLSYTKYPEGSDTYEMQIFNTEPKYRFSENIRSMMAGCITCHATVYGNIIFWMFVFMVKNTSLSQELFDFTTLPTIYFIGVWFAYWLSLAYTCTVAYKRMP